MKIKPDFITNSSSASFSILKKNISEKQIILIFHHIKVGDLTLKEKNIGYDQSDEWLITETKNKICGSTSMDNFDMYNFLTSIGVSEEDIDYDHI